jgi:hypothetical protein
MEKPISLIISATSGVFSAPPTSYSSATRSRKPPLSRVVVDELDLFGQDAVEDHPSDGGGYHARLRLLDKRVPSSSYQVFCQ